MTWSGSWPVEEPIARRVVDDRVLTVVFVAVAAASSWFVVGNATGAVQEFGGRVTFLGAAVPYAASAPTLIAWGLVLTAALAIAPFARQRNARRALRIGLAALVTGAVLEVLGAGVSLWVSGLSSRFGTYLLNTGEINDLLRVSAVLAGGALLTFAVGALSARPKLAESTDPLDARAIALRQWRLALGVLAVGLCLGAMSQGYDLVSSVLAVALPVQLTLAMVEGMTIALWVSVATSLVLIGRAMHADVRLHRLTPTASIAAMGMTLLAVASATQLVYYEVWLASPTTGWITVLAKLSSASVCIGWLVLMVAFGLGALAVRDRRGLASLPSH